MTLSEVNVETAVLAILRDFDYGLQGSATITPDGSAPERAVVEAAA